ncbi:MAG: hypothetical protein J0H31_08220 [Alphaproteobacteria bacterium]|nr:hypothetical protein [Alphaproteobacteria bacterium]
MIDGITDNLDIARLSGVRVERIVQATMQVVAEFLLETMTQDSAMKLMQAACADLQARMPHIPKGTH